MVTPRERHDLIEFTDMTGIGIGQPEPKTGIGSADMVYMDSTWPGTDVVVFVPVGRFYGAIRREATWRRRRAFDNAPDFGDPPGTAMNFHPESGAHPMERTMGCPIGWKR